jgi:hypothetical protein
MLTVCFRLLVYTGDIRYVFDCRYSYIPVPLRALLGVMYRCYTLYVTQPILVHTSSFAGVTTCDVPVLYAISVTADISTVTADISTYRFL